MAGTALFISIIIYCIYFCGLFLVFSSAAEAAFVRFKLRRRLTGTRSLMYIDKALVRLVMLCFLIFSAAFSAALGSFVFPAALAAGLMAGSVPALVFLLTRGRNKRKSGKEGIGLVTELYRQYRIKNCNIYEAMDHAVRSGNSYPLSRKQLSMLLMRLRDDVSRDAVKAACERFAGSVSALWGRMLAACIETSVLTGADVSAALQNISEQLKMQQRRYEERKRLNSESVRMAVFLVPLLYAGTMIIAAGFLGMELSDILRNQLASPEGLILLLICVFLFLVDLVILQAIEGSEV